MGLYIVNRNDNEMKEVTPATFKGIEARERDHLQEWIANNPDCLCQSEDEENEKPEKLLIIQKEFSGFHGTRERPDLLALDGNGRLVVIENKRDTSTRDVVWQALKYAAYCSTLTGDQVADIFQRYAHSGENAKDKIAQFLGKDDFTDANINPHGNPRIFLIARDFPKEVTATALWLIERKIDIRCYTAIPYLLDGKNLLKVERLIPPPKVEQFMIRLAEKKEAEEKASSDADERRYDLRRRFWRQTLAEFRSRGISLFQNNNESASGEIYTSAEFSELGGYEMAFKYKAARISLYINVDGNEKIKTRKAFDSLARHKDEIQRDFGDEYKLHWLRDEGLRQKDTNASQIMCEKEFPGYEEETWKERINWLADNMPKFESAVKDRLKQARDDALAD